MRRVLILKQPGDTQMRLLSTFVALALSASAAMAGDTGPLPPGAPAGVKHAQEGDNTILLVALGAGAVAFAAVVISNGGHTTLSPVVQQSASTTSATSG
jgi:hypothetical protein